MTSLPPGYFDAMYTISDDPWGFRDRPYERRKRALTLASLPDGRYATVFEPGCSIGVLTAELADRADRVLAMDVSSEPLRTAASVLPANVELRQGTVPADWPAEAFDLVVLSEVGYYLGPEELRRTGDLAAGAGRDLIAVHWRHAVADYPTRGDDAQRLIGQAAAAAGMYHLASHVEEDLLIDVWSTDRRSVARRTGLIATRES